MLNYSITLMLVISMLLMACNKKENPPISQDEMWDCHHETIWDSLLTKENLIGEWEWEFISCYTSPEDINYEAFAGMTITFKEDSTLDLKENGQITQTANWEISNRIGGLFAISVDPIVIELYGQILFCHNRVAFNNSYIDGCDNYFKRKE